MLQTQHSVGSFWRKSTHFSLIAVCAIRKQAEVGLPFVRSETVVIIVWNHFSAGYRPCLGATSANSRKMFRATSTLFCAIISARFNIFKRVALPHQLGNLGVEVSPGAIRSVLLWDVWWDDPGKWFWRSLRCPEAISSHCKQETMSV